MKNELIKMFDNKNRDLEEAKKEKNKVLIRYYNFILCQIESILYANEK